MRWQNPFIASPNHIKEAIVNTNSTMQHTRNERSAPGLAARGEMLPQSANKVVTRLAVAAVRPTGKIIHSIYRNASIEHGGYCQRQFDCTYRIRGLTPLSPRIPGD